MAARSSTRSSAQHTARPALCRVTRIFGATGLARIYHDNSRARSSPAHGHPTCALVRRKAWSNLPRHSYGAAPIAFHALARCLSTAAMSMYFSPRSESNAPPMCRTRRLTSPSCRRPWERGSACQCRPERNCWSRPSSRLRYRRIPRRLPCRSSRKYMLTSASPHQSPKCRKHFNSGRRAKAWKPASLAQSWASFRTINNIRLPTTTAVLSAWMLLIR